MFDLNKIILYFYNAFMYCGGSWSWSDGVSKATLVESSTLKLGLSVLVGVKFLALFLCGLFGLRRWLLLMNLARLWTPFLCPVWTSVAEFYNFINLIYRPIAEVNKKWWKFPFHITHLSGWLSYKYFNYEGFENRGIVVGRSHTLCDINIWCHSGMWHLGMGMKNQNRHQ